MLTPCFSCEQNGNFVIVKIVLSAICKVLESVFDINGTQFTFHCSPYYLRLKFNEELQEGKGERATYDLEANTLTVYLPKAVDGQPFTQLDNPGYLIATDLQRKRLVSIVSGDAQASASANEEGEELEAEFVQELPTTSPTGDKHCSTEDNAPAVCYGFANHFSGLFARLDEDVVREVLDLPEPETTSPEQRRTLRVETENTDFDEEALLVAFEDADGDVAEVLRYVPAHIHDFQRALQSDGVVYASLPQTPGMDLRTQQREAEEQGLEEEEATLAAGSEGPVNIWQGNVAEFRRPLIEEVTDAAAALQQPTPTSTVPEPASPNLGLASGAATGSGVRLAIPNRRPCLSFTPEENDVLMRLKVPRLLFPPSVEAVAALTVDLLLSEAYDDLVTGGQGCSETLWNLVKLSPALSYLDPADSVHDACVAFTRRVLVYPLHRHMALAQRSFAVAGTRLLLGRAYVVRALLRVRRVLAHAEHKHVLATVFLDPLIAYWMNAAEADERLVHIALEMHEDVTRKHPVAVREPKKGGRNTVGSPLLLAAEDRKRLLEPITLLTVGLPLTEE